MQRFFKVLKPTFIWDEGAIITNKDLSEEYRSISSVWDKADVPIDSEYISARIIQCEANRDFFEEVWPIGKLEKFVFGTRDQARAAVAKIYKGDSK